MATIIDGKAISAAVLADVAAEVKELKEKGIVPGLAVIIVGDDPASRVYVNNKKKACANAGIYSEEFALPADTTQDELLALVASLNGRSDINGILCQLPLPAHIDDKAVIAAIYLDAGMEEARKFILRFVLPMLKAHKPKAFKDYKTALQEIIQQNPEEHLEYVLTGESGPDHDKHFTVEVHLNSNVIGKGGGRSKKEAEQQAAREALELMGY